MRAFWKVDRCDDDELRSKNTSVIPSLTNFPYLKDDTRTNWTVVSPYRSSLKMDGLKYGNQDDGFKKQSKTAKHSRNPSMDKDDQKNNDCTQSLAHTPLKKGKRDRVSFQGMEFDGKK